MVRVEPISGLGELGRISAAFPVERVLELSRAGLGGSCRAYARHGFDLVAIDRFAYAALPDEVRATPH